MMKMVLSAQRAGLALPLVDDLLEDALKKVKLEAGCPSLKP
jgi:hypothetical protein